MSMALSCFARYRTQARFFMPIPLCILSSDAIAPKFKIHGRAGGRAPTTQKSKLLDIPRKASLEQAFYLFHKNYWRGLVKKRNENRL
jgi:hypothetical protein